LHGRKRDTVTGAPDVSWLNASGELMDAADWHEADGHFLGMQLAGSALNDNHAQVGDTVLVLFNSADEALLFPLETHAVAKGNWRIEIDTSQPDAPVKSCESSVQLEARSVLVLCADCRVPC